MTTRSRLDLAFTHTRLLVSDYRACFHFYRDVLGFEVAWGDEDGGYADFRTGETTLALFDRAAMAETVGTNQNPTEMEDGPPATEPQDESQATQPQDEVAVIFRVDSVDEAHEQLQTDATFVTKPHDRPEWGIRVAHLRDPAGTLLELNEPLEER